MARGTPLYHLMVSSWRQSLCHWHVRDPSLGHRVYQCLPWLNDIKRIITDIIRTWHLDMGRQYWFGVMFIVVAIYHFETRIWQWHRQENVGGVISSIQPCMKSNMCWKSLMFRSWYLPWQPLDRCPAAQRFQHVSSVSFKVSSALLILDYSCN